MKKGTILIFLLSLVVIGCTNVQPVPKKNVQTNKEVFIVDEVPDEVIPEDDNVPALDLENAEVEEELPKTKKKSNINYDALLVDLVDPGDEEMMTTDDNDLNL